MSNEGPERDEQKLRLQENIHASKQCLKSAKRHPSKSLVKRYTFRFGTASNYPGRAQIRNTALPANYTSQNGDNHIPYLSNKDKQSPNAHLKFAKPSPNMVRKRAAEGGGAYPI
ncbi:uncharacterized protein PgNI_11825 [Pyricularia grisea]|uniref:Uncharacterized protein n=1 Tax=Pyricularia grisea TaxID=148305 RepID=A0A6P8ANB6_PYRGI|nr:uncharacterized protein PgNI_11825 [Pyricularia grisea]TLD03516.1 hypothetical protein PgNI_11825 [Pyricularia grisea]